MLRMGELWRDAALVARKDLTIEARSKVTLSQIAPFALMVLVLFAFALDNLVIRDVNRAGASVPANALAASTVTSGLFWLAVLFSALIAVQRSFAIEVADGGRDGLRLSSLDPAGIFLGKALAIWVQLVLLQVVLGLGSILFFRPTVREPLVFFLTAVLATIGLITTGTCYGALSAGLRVRDTLLPILYFPVVTPLVLAAVKATAAALTGELAEAWPWVRLLAVFAVIYSAMGVLVFGQLLEDS
jgi:heme exporter protein B